ncbi:hypothetical protein [Actinacidiphila yeochonensis]|uniref:hypothetical protein n=1 Tax=Actinacidiphila yeochonensis TaxID=89050 RepID=UPI000689FCCA|nr:hypothetical protein [Actinacidiphila yeochonensis]
MSEQKPRSALPVPVVDFLDTSVFVELLDVPYMNDHRDEMVAELIRGTRDGVRLVLPTATIIETGNHVFQVKDGTARRSCAARFAEQLRRTAAGEAPWVLHERTWDGAFLRALCDGGSTAMGLTEHAARRQLGAGDLSIVAERDLFARKVRARVRIWTREAAMATWTEV